MQLNKKKLLNISEVSKLINLPSYTIRFWGKKFKQIRPIILSGKRRYYATKDIDLIKFIKFLLKEEKLTIEGAKKLLNTKINKLDDYKGSSIKDNYISKKLKLKSRLLLEKIKKLKK
tara:strand:- start:28 stop:378 length:351 start_codon:yes stop_codon:yes gene_type:complete